MLNYDIQYIRNQFPALNMEERGYPAVFLDGPGGTQTPQRVIDAMVYYIVKANSNAGGPFKTSMESDRLIKESREALADFLGSSPEEISFGQNTTSLMYMLAFALGKDIKEGDEILITEIDHEANRGPWQALEEKGAVIKEVRMDPKTCTLDMDDFSNKISDKTKIAAFNYAANAVGTISDVKTMITKSHEAGAITVVDAVHFALHGIIDVKELDVDFLLCSAYKFFGPHLGVLYGKKEIYQSLKTYKLRTQKDEIPHLIETGTLNHEGIAGAKEAVEFIADIGEKFGNPIVDEGKSLRRINIEAGMKVIEDHETPIANYLIEELEKIDKVNLYIPPKNHPRTSTVSFTIDGINSFDISESLGEKGFFTWAGHFYAKKTIEVLDVEKVGGLVRVGLAPYNTMEEIERLVSEIKNLV